MKVAIVLTCDFDGLFEDCPHSCGTLFPKTVDSNLIGSIHGDTEVIEVQAAVSFAEIWLQENHSTSERLRGCSGIGRVEHDVFILTYTFTFTLEQD